MLLGCSIFLIFDNCDAKVHKKCLILLLDCKKNDLGIKLFVPCGDRFLIEFDGF